VTANPWLVPVTALRRQPGTRREERRAGRIGELSVAGSVVPAGAEAVAVAVLDSILGGVEVAADIRAPWQGECRRCLRPLTGELHCEVRELYRPRAGDAGKPGSGAPDPRRGPADRGHHHSDLDEDTYPLEGDQLDLRPLVRDALLLELPLAPLCRADCQGLCAQCGADLNAGPCDCAPSRDPRWDVLDALRGAGEQDGRAN
jgi:uncharacterized protein